MMIMFALTPELQPQHSQRSLEFVQNEPLNQTWFLPRSRSLLRKSEISTKTLSENSFYCSILLLLQQLSLICTSFYFS